MFSCFLDRIMTELGVKFELSLGFKHTYGGLLQLQVCQACIDCGASLKQTNTNVLMSVVS